ncbi:NO-binding membrane sensor protein with MHYT domain [Streptacidiphilus sp. BW17]
MTERHLVGQINQLAYGWVTPVIAYISACSGSAIALRSVRWALASDHRRRPYWLAVGSVALGSGIWTMHFVAMLGFAVSGMDIRYEVSQTVLSLLVAIVMVAVGIFVVGYGRRRGLRIVLGGLTTGLGVAGMHYLGMDAIRMQAQMVYNSQTVGISVLIAVAAATAALWATVNVQGTASVVGAALIMGVAVCAMHYTGMAAVSVKMTDGGAAMAPQGAALPEFVVPLLLGFGLLVFFTFISFDYAPSFTAGTTAPTRPSADGDPAVQGDTLSRSSAEPEIWGTPGVRPDRDSVADGPFTTPPPGGRVEDW